MLSCSGWMALQDLQKNEQQSVAWWQFQQPSVAHAEIRSDPTPADSTDTESDEHAPASSGLPCACAKWRAGVSAGMVWPPGAVAEASAALWARRTRRSISRFRVRFAKCDGHGVSGQ